MSVIDGVWRFFMSGGGVAVGVIAFCSVGFVFVVTALCGMFNRQTAVRDKGFFLWLAELGSMAVTAAAILDCLSAKSFGLMRTAMLVVLAVVVFVLEYGLLRLQVAIAQALQRRRGTDCYDEGAVAEGSYDLNISPVFRTKTARIKEVLLKKVERCVMEKGAFGMAFGRNYATDCIARLKDCALEGEDRRTVEALEYNLNLLLSKGEGASKRAISENCGRLITLMAKYLR